MMKKVACVGILVADVMASPVDAVPERGMLSQVNSITVHNGGNAMTASINLTKMGVDAKIVGKVGADMFGTYLRSCLDKAGVDTRALKEDDKVQTSASVVLSESSGERSFLHCVGTNAVFSIDDIDYDVVGECDLVFVTGSFLMNTFDGEQTADFLKKCQEKGKTTFLDVCWDAKGNWGKVLDVCMPYLDFFMPSIDEAVEIAGGETDPDKIADVFMKKGVKNVIIKLGKKGSYLRLAGQEKGKVFPIVGRHKPVDTTGAGDSFCSGFLAAYARDEEIEKCMMVASATGGLCTMAKGATAGTKSYEETLKFLEEETC
ncbi:MAG: carbohydrate kinase family protein [Clostridia bacterium]|nr:carbohydrate kinase family protein [Clostridia bacterium]